MKDPADREILRLAADGRIDADELMAACKGDRALGKPGRPIGLRFLFRLPASAGRKSVLRDDAWRVDRALRLIGQIKDRNGLQILSDALARWGVTPALSPKTSRPRPS